VANGSIATACPGSSSTDRSTPRFGTVGPRVRVVALDAVSGEIQDGRVAVPADHVLDRLPDDADLDTRPGLVDRGLERHLGGLDQLGVPVWSTVTAASAM